MQPGAKLTIKVVSKQRRTQLAFVRVTPGRTTLARRTLRSGRFTVTVPAGAGVTYELRATTAGRRTVRRFTTPIPPPPAPPIVLPAPPVSTPTPTPTPTLTPVVDCAAGNTGTPELTVKQRELTITNRGPGCLDVPLSLQAAWTTAAGDLLVFDCEGAAMPLGSRPPLCIGLPAYEVLYVGEWTTRPLPIGLVAGTYRVSALGVAATVDVTP